MSDAVREGEQYRFDVIVLGAGAGGMTAATVSAGKGLRTLLIESSPYVGGTTALSSGTAWVPGNPYLGSHAIEDTSAALRYLCALTGKRANVPLLEAFLEAGPQMLTYMENHTHVRFRPYAVQPDYRHDLPGATIAGRALEPMAFDGRLLNKHFADIRPPIPEFTLLGGMMITRGEAAQLLKGIRSTKAVALALKLVSRQAIDRLSYLRGTRLVLGNALVARLYASLLDTGATIWRDTHVTRLLRRQDGRVTGVSLLRQGQSLDLHANRGVVLAGGGFPASESWRERYLPRPTAPFTAACETSKGETIQLGIDAGGTLGNGSKDNALWFPSSSVKRRDGSLAVWPHIVLDRAKPGLIAVGLDGRRFCNEAVSYHDFTRAMYQAHSLQACIPAYLICDRHFLWKYGLGLIRPQTYRLNRYIKNGYLKQGHTLAELAGVIGVSAENLIATVARYNGFAQTGCDSDFHKGETAYERANGDSTHQPNPCIGPIRRAPYFAVQIYPTPLGTSHGLAINPHAQVLDVAGAAIDGLYACGNDVDSIFSGEYPGPGAQIGPAMTFGYIAANHLAS
jgi:3-oxosteroid 1-dehydrogenase